MARARTTSQPTSKFFVRLLSVRLGHVPSLLSGLSDCLSISAENLAPFLKLLLITSSIDTEENHISWLVKGWSGTIGGNTFVLGYF